MRSGKTALRPGFVTYRTAARYTDYLVYMP